MNRYRTLKEEAYAANMEIPGQHLALYTWGNVSAYDPQRAVFAIKPSGVPYPELSPDKMVVVDLDGAVVEGTLKPSSDTPTHAVLYREFVQKDGNALGGIIHTHSTAAVSWAQALCPVPLFGTTHADYVQTEIPCTPYLTPQAVAENYEKETGLLIANYFRRGHLNPDEVPMVLAGGHGPFAWGTTAAGAVYNAAVLEEICRMAAMTRLINPAAGTLPDYIVRKHYERKHGPGAYYGQQT